MLVIKGAGVGSGGIRVQQRAADLVVVRAVPGVVGMLLMMLALHGR